LIQCGELASAARGTGAASEEALDAAIERVAVAMRGR